MEWRNNFTDGAVPTMITILRHKYCQCPQFRQIIKAGNSSPYYMEDTNCRFWGIRTSEQVSRNTPCNESRGQNWMGKILTMLSLRMKEVTMETVTKVVLIGHLHAHDVTEERHAQKIVPDLFSNPVQVLGEDWSDELDTEV